MTEGITKREWFAGQALPSVINDANSVEAKKMFAHSTAAQVISTICRLSYAIADGMILAGTETAQADRAAPSEGQPPLRSGIAVTQDAAGKTTIILTESTLIPGFADMSPFDLGRHLVKKSAIESADRVVVVIGGEARVVKNRNGEIVASES